VAARASCTLPACQTASDWATIFPNATCATALIDRTVHPADVIAIEGDSYRPTWVAGCTTSTGSRVWVIWA